MLALVLSNFVLPPREASVANAGRNGALTDTDFRGCRWIEGVPTPQRRRVFCSLILTEGESWRAEHRGVVSGEDLALGA